MPRVVLDCDTGTDDAIAIALAALHPDLDLLGVSSVWGNHCVAATTDNTLRILAHVGAHEVEVHPGLGPPAYPRRMPLEPESLRPGVLPLPPTGAEPGQAAVPWLERVVAQGPVTLVATGPLTNVAALLARRPQVVGEVDHLVFLGGTREVRTSVTPYAERNVWNDPVAAEAVLAAPWRRLTVVTMDATYQALMDLDDAGRLDALGTPAGTAAAAMLRERVADYRDLPQLGGRAPVHDPLAVALLLDPDVVTTERVGLRVELDDPVRYGAIVDDASRPLVDLAVGCDRTRLLEILLTALG